MKNKVFLTSIFLISISLIFAIYRYKALDIPLIPGSLRANHIIEVQIKNKVSKGSFKTMINVPSKRYTPNIANENFNSEGYAMASFYNNEKRYIRWSGKVNKSRALIFYYRAEMKPGLSNLYNSPSIERFSYSTPVKKEDKKLLKNFLLYSKQIYTKDKTLLKKLRDCILLANCKKGEFLARYKYSNKKQALVLRYLFNQAGYQAVVARAFNVESRSKNELQYFVRVKLNGIWKNYLLDNNKLTSSYIFWDYYQKKETDNNSDIHYSISNNNNYSLNTEMSQTEFKHKIFGKISLKNLPLSTQLSFKILLLFPLGALIICFLRNVVGIPTFGTFLPILTAISYRDMGLFWGVSLLSLLIFAGILIRILLSKLRLLMVPRVSATLTIVILLIVIFSILANAFDFYPGLSIRFFPLVIITLLIERISISLDELGYLKTLALYLSTIFASIMAYSLMQSITFSYLIINFPELIFCILGLIILMGRYTGIRLLEYYRFRTFFKDSAT